MHTNTIPIAAGATSQALGWAAAAQAEQADAQADKAALVVLSLRQLGRDDLPDVERHLLGLDLADRRARFGGPSAMQRSPPMPGGSILTRRF